MTSSDLTTDFCHVRPHGRAAEAAITALVSQLEEEIVLGFLHPRERLIEDALIDRFGVKRHAVREALARLDRLGLVERQPNRGAMVRALTPLEVENIYAVREILELAAAGEVLRRARSEDLQRIIEAQKRHDDAVERKDPKTAFRANIGFHQAFFAACGNPELMNAINLYGQKAHAVRSLSIARPEYLTRSREEHWNMIDALRSDDEPWLLSVCRDHILIARDTYIEAYRRRFPGQSAQ
jgi:DNA-binding GntR family transcriptional regulator